MKRVHCRPRSPKPQNYPPRQAKCCCNKCKQPPCCPPRIQCCPSKPRCCSAKPQCCSPKPRCCPPKSQCCLPDPQCCPPKLQSCPPTQCCPPKPRCCPPKPACCSPRRKSCQQSSNCCEGKKKMIYFRPRCESPPCTMCEPRKPTPCCSCSADRCKRCGEKVFAAEKVLTSYGSYHLGCFSCYCCCKSLCVKTMYEACGEIYCRRKYFLFYSIFYLSSFLFLQKIFVKNYINNLKFEQIRLQF